MVSVTVDKDRGVLIVKMHGLAVVAAARAKVIIPLAAIQLPIEICSSEARVFWPGFRLIGSFAPGLLAAGTFISGNMKKRKFYYVADPSRAITINVNRAMCQGCNKFDQVVVQVPRDELHAGLVQDITRAVQEVQMSSEFHRVENLLDTTSVDDDSFALKEDIKLLNRHVYGTKD